MLTCVHCGNAIVSGKATKYCSHACGSADWQIVNAAQQREANRRSYAAHREKRKAQAQAVRQTDAHRAYRENYYRANRDRILAQDRARKAQIRDERVAYMREYNARPENKARQQAWRQTPAQRIKSTLWNFRLRSPLPADHPHDPIDPFDIFARDGWTCWKCGEHLDREMRGKKYHPKCPTLDHIKAVTLGGTHTFDNVRTACLKCNTSEGKATRRIKAAQRSAAHEQSPSAS